MHLPNFLCSSSQTGQISGRKAFLEVNGKRYRQCDIATVAGDSMYSATVQHHMGRSLCYSRCCQGQERLWATRTSLFRLALAWMPAPDVEFGEFHGSGYASSACTVTVLALPSNCHILKGWMQ
jgi:hypothetical protein